MTITSTVRALACALALGSTGLAATAAPVTRLADFLAAAPGPLGVLDFEALAPGQDLSGATHRVAGGPGTGIVFPDLVLDFQDQPLHLQVAHDDAGSNPTTSGSHSLGTDDIGNYHLLGAGTGFTLRLTESVQAFGLSFITPDAMFDDDIRLGAEGDLAALDAQQGDIVGTVGGVTYYAYFLGLVSSNGFDQVSVTYGPGVVGGPFLYNIDDIRVARAPAPVNEPGTMALAALALAAAALGRTRR